MIDLDERLQHASLAVRDRMSVLALPDPTERGAPVSRKGRPVLAAVGGLVVVLLIAGLTVWVARSSPRTVSPGPATRIVDVDVHDLRPGTVRKTRYTSRHDAAVFVARQNDGRVLAFLGESTHLGCKIALEDPANPFTLLPNVVFVDPCGGSLWALDGTCLDGPCPRSLDEFHVAIDGDRARIDLSTIIRGKSRASASPPSSRTQESTTNATGASKSISNSTSRTTD